jgi:hypothetical protein
MSGGTFAALLLGVIAVMFNAAILKTLSDKVALYERTTAPPQCGISMTSKDINTETTHSTAENTEPRGVFESNR